MAATEALGRRLLAAAMALPMVAPAQAETAPDRGQISFRHLDYLDRQPGRERVRVRAPSVALLAPLSSRWSVSAGAIADAISGASPAYHTSALGRFEDDRYAGDAALTRYFDDATLSVGGAYSTEADYVSRALSLQGSVSSADRNTTWAAGISTTRDRIDPVNRVVAGETKRTTDLLVGVTRVLGPRDVVQLNVSRLASRGYHSDPYKIFDRRPRERDATRLLLRWNHHVAAAGASLRSSLRLWHDDWGVRAQTVALELVQPLARGVTVTPSLRLHSQSAASFYLDAVPDPGPFVPRPPAGAELYSQDQRLSAFGALTLGLKLAWRFAEDWTVDVKLEHYAQRSRWHAGGRGSPHLADFNARFWQFGLARSF